MRRARRSFTPWSRETRERLDALGLPARPDPLRAVLPSRNDALGLALPADAAWERWGSQAVVVRVRDPRQGPGARRPSRRRRCVSASALASRSSCTTTRPRSISAPCARSSTGPDAAEPAPYTCCRWRSRGSSGRASASDLLDLVEETSLRGNPFEVRGRITSSSQFWNRERLVSGLLAETRAGRWVRRHRASALRKVVARARGRAPTSRALGLRRPRRVPSRDRVRARTRRSRSTPSCGRSAHASSTRRARCIRARQIPDAPAGEVDAAALTRVVRDLCSACAPFAEGRRPPPDAPRARRARAGRSAMDAVAGRPGARRPRDPARSAAQRARRESVAERRRIRRRPSVRRPPPAALGAAAHARSAVHHGRVPVALRPLPLAGGRLVDDARPRGTSGHPLRRRGARLHRRTVAGRAPAPPAHRYLRARALRPGSRAPGQPGGRQRGHRGSARGRRARGARGLSAARLGRVGDRRALRSRRVRCSARSRRESR